MPMLTYRFVATIEDIREVSLLAREIWHECYRDMLSFAQREFMLDMFLSETAIQKQIQEESTEYYILEANGEIAGFYAAVPQQTCLFLSKIYFRADMRGKGFAKTVLARLERQAKDLGLTKLRLGVCKQNPIATLAYERIGFTVVEEKTTHIGNGFYMDDYFMEMDVK